MDVMCSMRVGAVPYNRPRFIVNFTPGEWRGVNMAAKNPAACVRHAVREYLARHGFLQGETVESVNPDYRLENRITVSSRAGEIVRSFICNLDKETFDAFVETARKNGNAAGRECAEVIELYVKADRGEKLDGGDGVRIMSEAEAEKLCDEILDGADDGEK